MRVFVLQFPTSAGLYEICLRKTASAKRPTVVQFEVRPTAAAAEDAALSDGVGAPRIKNRKRDTVSAQAAAAAAAMAKVTAASTGLDLQDVNVLTTRLVQLDGDLSTMERQQARDRRR